VRAHPTPATGRKGCDDERPDPYDDAMMMLDERPDPYDDDVPYDDDWYDPYDW
jgi:hypothetical protein